MSIKSDAIVAELTTLRTQWDDEAQNHTPSNPGSIREKYDTAVEAIDAIIVHVQNGEGSLVAARIAMMDNALGLAILRVFKDAGPGN